MTYIMYQLFLFSVEIIYYEIFIRLFLTIYIFYLILNDQLHSSIFSRSVVYPTLAFAGDPFTRKKEYYI